MKAKDIRRIKRIWGKWMDFTDKDRTVYVIAAMIFNTLNELAIELQDEENEESRMAE